MRQYAYEMSCGDVLNVEIRVYEKEDNRNVPVELAGVKVLYVLSKTLGGEPLVTLEATITGGSSITVSFREADTLDLEPGEYYHGCRIRDAVQNPLTLKFERALVNLEPAPVRGPA